MKANGLRKIKNFSYEKNIHENKLRILNQYTNYLYTKHIIASRKPSDLKLKTIDLVEQKILPKKTILNLIETPRSTYYKWLKRFQKTGNVYNLYTLPNKTKLTDRKDVKEQLFKILHSPPSEHGFNRTSWKIDDLQQALEQAEICIGKHAIRKIIKDSGYRWMKARKVLTSNDPNYREKLDTIHSILSCLGDNEGFFSIDEYGPFSVKHHVGRKLVAPGETHTVSQWQKSKGVLIMTAALELLTNQITHFYSNKKDTEEMIKLLDLLLETHKHLDKIYLSWDSASWHISKKLFDKIKEKNTIAETEGTTQVQVAPLPSGAQFLNVIESVFSGLSRAVIHNSNYHSKEQAMNAIDAYFWERNSYYKNNPKRAGRKIWGNERVNVKFTESNNCKDSRYR